MRARKGDRWMAQGLYRLRRERKVRRQTLEACCRRRPGCSRSGHDGAARSCPWIDRGREDLLDAAAGKPPGGKRAGRVHRFIRPGHTSLSWRWNWIHKQRLVRPDKNIAEHVQYRGHYQLANLLKYSAHKAHVDFLPGPTRTFELPNES